MLDIDILSARPRAYELWCKNRLKKDEDKGPEDVGKPWCSFVDDAPKDMGPWFRRRLHVVALLWQQDGTDGHEIFALQFRYFYVSKY